MYGGQVCTIYPFCGRPSGGGAATAKPAPSNPQTPPQAQKPSCFGVFFDTAVTEPLHKVADAVKEGPEILENLGEAFAGAAVAFGARGALTASAVGWSAGAILQNAADLTREYGPEGLTATLILLEAQGLRNEVRAVTNGACR